MTTIQQSRLTRVRIGPRHAGISMSPEEFDALPPDRWDDRYHYELIRGVLVVTPPPGAGERGPNEWLGYLLLMYRQTAPQGLSLDATLPEQTIFVTCNRRRCDRAIWTGLGRAPDEEHDCPSIVVEFVSASKRDIIRDYEEKRDEYLGAGILEYWVVDRFRRLMTVFKPAPDGFRAQVVRENESYQTDLLPGFSLPLDQVLANADLWTRNRRHQPPAQGAD